MMITQSGVKKIMQICHIRLEWKKEKNHHKKHKEEHKRIFVSFVFFFVCFVVIFRAQSIWRAERLRWPNLISCHLLKPDKASTPCG
jgi:hypothetical protein